MRKMVIGLGAMAFLSFLFSMALCPGGYNPCLRMLSYLGRKAVAGVDFPLCHYLFIAGMVFASFAVFLALKGWGGGICALGLLAVAALPEDVSAIGHDISCHIATLGGVIAVVARMRNRFGRISAFVLFIVVGVFGSCIVLHALGIIPFAPAVPTLQKLVILSFAAWTVLQLFHCKRG